MSPGPTGIRALPAIVVSCALLMAAPLARAAEIEPDALRLLRSMADNLSEASQFSFTVDELYDATLEVGTTIQMRTLSTVAVRRPDGLRVVSRGDTIDRDVWFDGRQFTMLDRNAGQYGSVEVPPGLDAAFDHLAEEYGVTVTLSDLIYPDVYRVLLEKVQTGLYLGRRSVGGESAHHLVFMQEDIDWQIWIDDRAIALPLKVVIIFKKEPGAPRFMASFQDWNLGKRLPDSVFQFAPPADARRVEFRELAGRQAGARGK